MSSIGSWSNVAKLTGDDIEKLKELQEDDTEEINSVPENNPTLRWMWDNLSCSILKRSFMEKHDLKLGYYLDERLQLNPELMSYQGLTEQVGQRYGNCPHWVPIYINKYHFKYSKSLLEYTVLERVKYLYGDKYNKCTRFKPYMLVDFFPRLIQENLVQLLHVGHCLITVQNKIKEVEQEPDQVVFNPNSHPNSQPDSEAMKSPEETDTTSDVKTQLAEQLQYFQKEMEDRILAHCHLYQIFLACKVSYRPLSNLLDKTVQDALGGKIMKHQVPNLGQFLIIYFTMGGAYNDQLKKVLLPEFWVRQTKLMASRDPKTIDLDWTDHQRLVRCYQATTLENQLMVLYVLAGQNLMAPSMKSEYDSLNSVAPQHSVQLFMMLVKKLATLNNYRGLTQLLGIRVNSSEEMILILNTAVQKVYPA